MGTEVSFEGVGEFSLPFKSSLVQNQDEGKTVCPHATTPKTLIVCTVEKPFIGILGSVEKDGSASAIVRGCKVKLSYNDAVQAAPALGWVELVGDGAGKCKVPATAGTGKFYWVLEKDTTAKTVTVFLG